VALTDDGLTVTNALVIYFARASDIYRAQRTTANDGFGPPSPVAELNTPGFDVPEWVSADDCTLYFISDNWLGMGQKDIFVARRGK
jgi:hypothetical protein